MTRLSDEDVIGLADERILFYHPLGGLDQSARLLSAMAAIKHQPVRMHFLRVALGSEATAIHAKKDAKAAFFGGYFHDIGKILQDPGLFTGRNITPEEYAIIKNHAVDGHRILKDLHPFTAGFSGFHHQVYKNGYGTLLGDLDPNWDLATVKKQIDLVTIVSIHDFRDAFTYRDSKILDGSDVKSRDLLEMLYEKYPDDHLYVDFVLGDCERIGI